MSLQERIAHDLKDAMRAKDELRRSTLRLLRSALKNKEIDKGQPLDESEVQEIVQREAKMRRESASQYSQGGREDLVQRELAELEVLKAYMPRQLDKSEIVEIVRPILDELGPVDPSKMGLVMGRVMPQVKGKADGKLVNQVVREMLSESS